MRSGNTRETPFADEKTNVFTLHRQALQYNTIRPIVNSLTPHLKRTYTSYKIVKTNSVESIMAETERHRYTCDLKKEAKEKIISSFDTEIDDHALLIRNRIPAIRIGAPFTREKTHKKSIYKDRFIGG